MNATNKVLSIIAFYLSEYDMDAVSQLGYKTRTAAIQAISSKIGSGNNYLKLRRDEFDALPDSSSSRKGWRNRPPLKDVVDLAAYLHLFSFEELTDIVKSFLNDQDESALAQEADTISLTINQLKEDEIERIVNFSDPSATLVFKTQTGKQRIYNRTKVDQLKKLYRGCCQICGFNPVAEFDVEICEAHHIDYFSESKNNDSTNIIILCPNHHRLIHRLRPNFDSQRASFIIGKHELKIIIDFHLKNNINQLDSL